MGDPHNSEDVKKALDVIRAQGRPPFECPFCKRTYQSITGALYHLGVTSPNNDLIPRCTLPAALSGTRSAGRSTPKTASRAQSPASVRRKKTRQPLTYEESQRLVEIKLHNDYFRLQIDDELALCNSKDRSSDLEEGGLDSNPATPTNALRSVGKSSKIPKAKASKRKGASKLTSKQEENGGSGGAKSEHVQLPEVELEVLDDADHPDAPDRASAYFRYIEQSFEELDDLVEYDMDDEDYHWLDMMNEKRKEEGLPLASQDCFELLMDRFEKECFFESHLTDDPTDANPYNIDENAVCCICNDGECHNTNAILFCDMCNLAVHQECYGIPYIPEGQWLCRRCMHSPSRMVNCVLCPNKGGAFKQTADGHWSHMLCALWIPEVQFANPVFLEPIDSIEKIPPARWRLTCYICKCRYGACIQCSSKNCFVAFHVSCAQQNGLYMKVEVCGATDVAVKKVAYCKMHSPRRGSSTEDVSASVDVERMEESGEAGEEQDGTREGSSVKDQDVDSEAETPLKPRSFVPPIVNLPFVPQHRLNRISAKVTLPRKTQFIPVLVSYWKLKRQSRNGVPLLRRLQASSHGQRVNMYKLSEEELDTLKEQLSVWKKLRHDLERVRMLAELVCRREKQKKELVQLTQQIFEYKVSPDMCLMKKMIQQLKKKDVAEIFAEPVPVDEVQDYLDVIKEPMDFSTMEKKLASFSYLTLDDFERDFTLVWKNAMTYNDPSTVYYRAAVRMKLEGQKMFKLARDDLSSCPPETLSDFPLFYSPPPAKPEGENPDVATGSESVQPPPSGTTSSSTTTATATTATSNRKRSSEDTPLSPSILEEKLEILQQQLLSVDKLPMRARIQKKKDLELEVAQLRKQVKRKRKAAFNSCSIDPSVLLDIALSAEPSKTTRSSRKTAPTRSDHHHQVTSPERSSSRFKSSSPNTPTPRPPPSSISKASESAQILLNSNTTDDNTPGSDRGGRSDEKKKRRPRDSRGLPRKRPPPRSGPSAGGATATDKKHRPNDDSEMLSPSEKKKEGEERPLQKTALSTPFVKSSTPAARNTASRRSKLGRKRSRVSKVSSSDSDTPQQDHRKGELKDVAPSKSLPQVAEEVPATPQKQKQRGESVPPGSKPTPHSRNPVSNTPVSSSRGRGANEVDLVQPKQKRTPGRGSASLGAKRRKPSPRKPPRTPATAATGGGVGTSVRTPPPQPPADENTTGKENQPGTDSPTPAIPSATSKDMLTAPSSPKKPRKINSAANAGSNRRARRSGSANPRKPAAKKRPRNKLVLSSTDEEDQNEVQLNHLVEPQQGERTGRKVSNDEGAKEVFENHVDATEALKEGRKESTGEVQQDNSSDVKAKDSVPAASNRKGSVAALLAELYNKKDPLNFWDVVWAKCPGYPHYPALIVDPQVPSAGFEYYGAKVDSPTDEVYKLKEKAPKSAFLVNFFDSRRTWYWLPGSKLGRLGKTQAGDDYLIKSCPPRSKKAVQAAYERAQTFLQTVAEGKTNAKQPLQPPNGGPLTPEDGNNTPEVPKNVEDAGTETDVAASCIGNVQPNSSPPLTASSSKSPVVTNNCDTGAKSDGPDRNPQQPSSSPSGVSIWNRRSDEVSAAEQLTLLNAYIPEPPFAHDKRKPRSSAGRLAQSNSNIQPPSASTTGAEQKNTTPGGHHDSGGGSGGGVDSSQSSSANAVNCKVSHQNATAREDEFIAEDTSTSSVSGTPEVSSIA